MKKDELNLGYLIPETGEEAVREITKYNNNKKKYNEAPQFKLEGLVIRDADLHGFDMGDLTCRRCFFVDCDFRDVEFNRIAAFGRCHFINCNFAMTRLDFIYVDDSIFDCCNFYQATMYGISLKNTYFPGSNFNEVYSDDKELKELIVKFERAEVEHRLIEFRITEQKERLEEEEWKKEHEAQEEEADDDE